MVLWSAEVQDAFVTNGAPNESDGSALSAPGRGRQADRGSRRPATRPLRLPFAPNAGAAVHPTPAPRNRGRPCPRPPACRREIRRMMTGVRGRWQSYGPRYESSGLTNGAGGVASCMSSPIVVIDDSPSDRLSPLTTASTSADQGPVRPATMPRMPTALTTRRAGRPRRAASTRSTADPAGSRPASLPTPPVGPAGDVEKAPHVADGVGGTAIREMGAVDAVLGANEHANPKDSSTPKSLEKVVDGAEPGELPTRCAPCPA